MRAVPPGLLAGLFLIPGVLGADPGRIVSPAAGERLLSGDVVEVRWEKPPADAVEAELLLSFGGRTPVPLRVGPRLDPSARSTWWVVPALATGAARLRLRVGVEGRELECEQSGYFEIVSRPGSAPASLRLHEDEWWVAVETPPALPISHLDSPQKLLPWDEKDPLAILLEDPSQLGEVSVERLEHGDSLDSDPLTPFAGRPATPLLLSVPRRE